MAFASDLKKNNMEGMAYVLLLKAETSGCKQARMSLKGLQEKLKV